MVNKFLPFVKAGCVILSVVAVSFSAAADFPSVEEFAGDYKFTAELKIEDNSYKNILSDNFVFSITESNTENSPNLIDFISNTFISTSYNPETGELTLTTNTIRYGNLPSYKYLGIADAEGSWTGMGALSTTKPVWQVSEDGVISIPDFTLVDYSKYSSTGKVTIIARFSGCEVNLSKNEEEPPVENESFYGRYNFLVTQTEYLYKKVANENGREETVFDTTVITEDYPLSFSINEYDQIISIEGYSMPDYEINSLRNRGYVKANVYTMDTDIYNGIEWVYNTDEDYQYTDAKLFGNMSLNQDWVQGRTAFKLTKNNDETYTLTPFSVWQRTMELIDGYGDVENWVRVYRPIIVWTEIRFVSYESELSSIENIEDVNVSENDVRYFNLQGIEVKNIQQNGIYIMVKGNKSTKIMI